MTDAQAIGILCSFVCIGTLWVVSMLWLLTVKGKPILALAVFLAPFVAGVIYGLL